MGKKSELGSSLRLHGEIENPGTFEQLGHPNPIVGHMSICCNLLNHCLSYEVNSFQLPLIKNRYPRGWTSSFFLFHSSQGGNEALYSFFRLHPPLSKLIGAKHLFQNKHLCWNLPTVFSFASANNFIYHWKYRQ